MLKRIVVGLGALAFLGVAAAGAVFLELQEYGRTPAGGGDQLQSVVVRPGTPLASTAEMLEASGVIRSPLKFRLLARLYGYDRRLKAGEYALTSSMSPIEVLDVLEKGLVKMHRLTVPEGLTLVQIAELVAKTGLASKADFISRASDPLLARRYGIPAETLEGYLFPETYLFPLSAGAEDIIATMLQRFRAVFRPEWEQRAAELGWSVHQAVTMASIIEKETGDPSERALISSVFHNRLERGMRLETDPTVIYGIRDFDGNLTRRHLETYSPYNTYLVNGLPPGPIANPGRDALRAALFPAKSDYLFFVSRNNGTHQFSTRLSDHNRAVQHYQPAAGRPKNASGGSK
jgi:UPF0755 protein